MKVYIAAPYELRDFAIAAMKALEARDIEVTSSWLRHLDEEGDKYARIDLADVARAEVLLAVNPEEFRRSGTGGRHVEFGYAVALNKRIFILGVRTNIFHHLSDVRVIESLEELWQ